MTPVNGEPGINQEMLQVLKEKATSDPENYGNVCLMLDAMSIRRQIVYSPAAKKMTGFVNLGNNEEEETEATEVLVMMVVGLKGYWKAPVSYYLTHTLTSEVQARLVTDLLHALSDCSVRVWAITMDGHPTNVSMCTELGVNLQPTGVVKPFFQHPTTGTPVYVIFDPPHMLKLMRSLLHDYGTLRSPTGSIHWKLLEDLQCVQEKAGLHAELVTSFSTLWPRERGPSCPASLSRLSMRGVGEVTGPPGNTADVLALGSWLSSTQQNELSEGFAILPGSLWR